MHSMFKKNKSNLIWQLLLIMFFITSTQSALVFAQNDQNELFLVAQKAFDDGFYDLAIRYIEQLLNDFPKTDKIVQAKLLLGQCYFFKRQLYLLTACRHAIRNS